MQCQPIVLTPCVCVCVRARARKERMVAATAAQRSAAQRREGVCLFARVRFDPLEHLERDEPADLNATAAVVDLKDSAMIRQQTHFAKRKADSCGPTGLDPL
jgi:hypothetical protein